MLWSPFAFFSLKRAVMRKTFPGYYRPSDSEFRKLWDKCLFVLDANVLLNLYRYSDDTKKNLLDILHRISARLWVPHQAALEYQRNRLDVISAQRKAYEQIEELLHNTYKKLETQLNSYKRHPLIDTQQLLTSISKAFDLQAEELKTVRQRHPDLFERDEVRETLTKILDGKIGPPYSEERLKQICKDGEERYAKQKPPGHADAKSKDGDKIFGDLVLWFQVIEKAASDQVPIIIVTDDVKEDWWWRHEGKIVGPNPELVDEMRSKANVDVYMYVSDQFMEYARGYLKQHIDQKVIDEIREVRRLEEQRRLQYERMLIHTEARVHQLQNELFAIDSNFAHLEAEIASLHRQLSEVSSEPAGGEPPAERQELITNLVSRIHETEIRSQMLKEQRRELNDLIRIELDERNSVLHRGLSREHLVRMNDGTFRRTVRPNFRRLNAAQKAEQVRGSNSRKKRNEAEKYRLTSLSELHQGAQ